MDVDAEDARGRLDAQQSHRRRQSDGGAFLGGDRMVTGGGSGEDKGKSPEVYAMPTDQSASSSSPSSTGITSFNPPPQSISSSNPWASMFNFGSAPLPSDGPDALDSFPMNPTDEHEGLQVYTVGHLLPRNTGLDDTQGSWTFDPSGLAMGGMLGGLGVGGGGGEFGAGAGVPDSSNAPEEASAQGTEEEEMVKPTPSNALIAAGSSSSPSAGGSSILVSGGGSTPGRKLRVRRSTFVPGWAVPPRVLLVDDDAVSRQLSSKFLKVFGCTTDVAVDGIAAVNKMNLEKYDLVLMVSIFQVSMKGITSRRRRCVSFGGLIHDIDFQRIGHCYAQTGRCICDEPYSQI
jgi:osomolarity two-component system response regulator SKN7